MACWAPGGASAPSAAELEEIDTYQNLVALRGREAGLVLRRGGRSIALGEWVRELCTAMRPVAAAMDTGVRAGDYTQALDVQAGALDDYTSLPSARIIGAMREQDVPFFRFAMNKSIEHAEYFRQRRLSRSAEREFEDTASASLVEQARIEAGDTESFEEYLKVYFAQSVS